MTELKGVNQHNLENNSNNVMFWTSILGKAVIIIRTSFEVNDGIKINSKFFDVCLWNGTGHNWESLS